MDTLEKIKQKINEVQTKSLVASEMKAFVTLVLSITNKNKEELAKLSDENIQIIKDSIVYIEENYAKQVNTLKEEKDSMAGQIEAKMETLKALIKEVKKVKPREIVIEKTEVIKEIPIVTNEIKEVAIHETPEEIKNKLESLKEEARLDASAIKNLPEIIQTQATRGRLVRVAHDTTLTGDGTESDPLKVANDVNAVWGQISGDIANQTDLTSNFFKLGYITKTENYTLTPGDNTIDCIDNTFTITLPSAVGLTTKIYNIKNTGTGVITIDANILETIDGELPITLDQWENLTVQSTGSNWIIL